MSENLGGAAPGNTNRLLHGNYTKRHGLVLGRLSRRFPGIDLSLRQFRSAVEGFLKERHGSVTLGQQSLLSTAVTAEMTRRVAERLVAGAGPDQTEQIEAWLRLATWAAGQRDLQLRRLGIIDMEAIPGAGGRIKVQTMPWHALP